MYLSQKGKTKLDGRSQKLNDLNELYEPFPEMTKHKPLILKTADFLNKNFDSQNQKILDMEEAANNEQIKEQFFARIKNTPYYSTMVKVNYIYILLSFGCCISNYYFHDLMGAFIIMAVDKINCPELEKNIYIKFMGWLIFLQALNVIKFVMYRIVNFW